MASDMRVQGSPRPPCVMTRYVTKCSTIVKTALAGPEASRPTLAAITVEIGTRTFQVLRRDMAETVLGVDDRTQEARMLMAARVGAAIQTALRAALHPVQVRLLGQEISLERRPQEEQPKGDRAVVAGTLAEATALGSWGGNVWTLH